MIIHMLMCLGAIDDETYVLCRLSVMGVPVHFQDLGKLQSGQIPSSNHDCDHF